MFTAHKATADNYRFFTQLVNRSSSQQAALQISPAIPLLVHAFLHALSEHLLSTCCVAGGTRLNAGVTKIKIKARTVPSRSSRRTPGERWKGEAVHDRRWHLVPGRPTRAPSPTAPGTVFGVPPPAQNGSAPRRSGQPCRSSATGDPSQQVTRDPEMAIGFPLLST